MKKKILKVKLAIYFGLHIFNKFNYKLDIKS